MKELSELVIKRRMALRRIAERADEIKMFQNEHDRSTSFKRKRAMLQRIDELVNQPILE